MRDTVRGKLKDRLVATLLAIVGIVVLATPVAALNAYGIFSDAVNHITQFFEFNWLQSNMVAFYKFILFLITWAILNQAAKRIPLFANASRAGTVVTGLISLMGVIMIPANLIVGIASNFSGIFALFFLIGPTIAIIYLDQRYLGQVDWGPRIRHLVSFVIYLSLWVLVANVYEHATGEFQEAGVDVSEGDSRKYPYGDGRPGTPSRFASAEANQRLAAIPYPPGSPEYQAQARIIGAGQPGYIYPTGIAVVGNPYGPTLTEAELAARAGDPAMANAAAARNTASGAIANAKAGGKDVTEAERYLASGDVLYGSGDYSGAEAEFSQAETAALAAPALAPTPVAPTVDPASVAAREAFVKARMTISQARTAGGDVSAASAKLSAGETKLVGRDFTGAKTDFDEAIRLANEAKAAATAAPATPLTPKGGVTAAQATTAKTQAQVAIDAADAANKDISQAKAKYANGIASFTIGDYPAAKAAFDEAKTLAQNAPDLATPPAPASGVTEQQANAAIAAANNKIAEAQGLSIDVSRWNGPIASAGDKRDLGNYADAKTAADTITQEVQAAITQAQSSAPPPPEAATAQQRIAEAEAMIQQAESAGAFVHPKTRGKLETAKRHLGSNEYANAIKLADLAISEAKRDIAITQMNPADRRATYDGLRDPIAELSESLTTQGGVPAEQLANVNQLIAQANAAADAGDYKQADVLLAEAESEADGIKTKREREVDVLFNQNSATISDMKQSRNMDTVALELLKSQSTFYYNDGNYIKTEEVDKLISTLLAVEDPSTVSKEDAENAIAAAGNAVDRAVAANEEHFYAHRELKYAKIEFANQNYAEAKRRADSAIATIGIEAEGYQQAELHSSDAIHDTSVALTAKEAASQTTTKGRELLEQAAAAQEADDYAAAFKLAQQALTADDAQPPAPQPQPPEPQAASTQLAPIEGIEFIAVPSEVELIQVGEAVASLQAYELPDINYREARPTDHFQDWTGLSPRQTAAPDIRQQVNHRDLIAEPPQVDPSTPADQREQILKEHKAAVDLYDMSQLDAFDRDQSVQFMVENVEGGVGEWTDQSNGRYYYKVHGKSLVWVELIDQNEGFKPENFKKIIFNHQPKNRRLGEMSYYLREDGTWGPEETNTKVYDENGQVTYRESTRYDDEGEVTRTHIYEIERNAATGRNVKTETYQNGQGEVYEVNIETWDDGLSMGYVSYDLNQDGVLVEDYRRETTYQDRKEHTRTETEFSNGKLREAEVWVRGYHEGHKYDSYYSTFNNKGDLIKETFVNFDAQNSRNTITRSYNNEGQAVREQKRTYGPNISDNYVEYTQSIDPDTGEKTINSRVSFSVDENRVTTLTTLDYNNGEFARKTISVRGRGNFPIALQEWDRSSQNQMYMSKAQSIEYISQGVIDIDTLIEFDETGRWVKKTIADYDENGQNKRVTVEENTEPAQPAPEPQAAPPPPQIDAAADLDGLPGAVVQQAKKTLTTGTSVISDAFGAKRIESRSSVLALALTPIQGTRPDSLIKDTSRTTLPTTSAPIIAQENIDVVAAVSQLYWVDANTPADDRRVQEKKRDVRVEVAKAALETSHTQQGSLEKAKQLVATGVAEWDQHSKTNYEVNVDGSYVMDIYLTEERESADDVKPSDIRKIRLLDKNEHGSNVGNTEYKVDDQGQLLLSVRKKNIFDSNNKQVYGEDISYNGDGTISRQEFVAFERDADGKPISLRLAKLAGDGTYQEGRLTTYVPGTNDQQQTITFRSEDGQQYVASRTEKVYSAPGILSQHEETNYNPAGDILTRALRTQSRINDSDRTTYHALFDGQGRLSEETLYEYASKDDYKRLKTRYSDGAPFERRVDHTSGGRILTEVTETVASSGDFYVRERIGYEYVDGEKVKEHTVATDEHGEITAEEFIEWNGNYWANREYRIRASDGSMYVYEAVEATFHKPGVRQRSVRTVYGESGQWVHKYIDTYDENGNHQGQTQEENPALQQGGQSSTQSPDAGAVAQADPDAANAQQQADLAAYIEGFLGPVSPVPATPTTGKHDFDLPIAEFLGQNDPGWALRAENIRRQRAGLPPLGPNGRPLTEPVRTDSTSGTTSPAVIASADPSPTTQLSAEERQVHVGAAAKAFAERGFALARQGRDLRNIPITLDEDDAPEKIDFEPILFAQDNELPADDVATMTAIVEGERQRRAAEEEQQAALEQRRQLRDQQLQYSRQFANLLFNVENELDSSFRFYEEPQPEPAPFVAFVDQSFDPVWPTVPAEPVAADDQPDIPDVEPTNIALDKVFPKTQRPILLASTDDLTDPEVIPDVGFQIFTFDNAYPVEPFDWNLGQGEDQPDDVTIAAVDQRLPRAPAIARPEVPGMFLVQTDDEIYEPNLKIPFADIDMSAEDGLMDSIVVAAKQQKMKNLLAANERSLDLAFQSMQPRIPRVNEPPIEVKDEDKLEEVKIAAIELFPDDIPKPPVAKPDESGIMVADTTGLEEFELFVDLDNVELDPDDIALMKGIVSDDQAKQLEKVMAAKSAFEGEVKKRERDRQDALARNINDATRALVASFDGDFVGPSAPRPSILLTQREKGEIALAWDDYGRPSLLKFGAEDFEQLFQDSSTSGAGVNVAPGEYVQNRGRIAKQRALVAEYSKSEYTRDDAVQLLFLEYAHMEGVGSEERAQFFDRERSPISGHLKTLTKAEIGFLKKDTAQAYAEGRVREHPELFEPIELERVPWHMRSADEQVVVDEHQQWRTEQQALLRKNIRNEIRQLGLPASVNYGSNKAAGYEIQPPEFTSQRMADALATYNAEITRIQTDFGINNPEGFDKHPDALDQLEIAQANYRTATAEADSEVQAQYDVWWSGWRDLSERYQAAVTDEDVDPQERELVVAEMDQFLARHGRELDLRDDIANAAVEDYQRYKAGGSNPVLADTFHNTFSRPIAANAMTPDIFAEMAAVVNTGENADHVRNNWMLEEQSLQHAYPSEILSGVRLELDPSNAEVIDLNRVATASIDSFVQQTRAYAKVEKEYADSSHAVAELERDVRDLEADRDRADVFDKFADSLRNLGIDDGPTMDERIAAKKQELESARTAQQEIQQRFYAATQDLKRAEQQRDGIFEVYKQVVTGPEHEIPGSDVFDHSDLPDVISPPLPPPTHAAPDADEPMVILANAVVTS